MLSLFALATAAYAAVLPATSLNERDLARRSLSGQATYYGGNVQGGACSFSTYTLPAGVYGTALSSSNWDNSGNCGGCVAVTYGGKTINAMVCKAPIFPSHSLQEAAPLKLPPQIVDECPNCGTNHLDLFENAFSALADTSLGVIDVTWGYVPCAAVTGNLEIHMKSGVSQYWFSAQVVNAHRRTASMQVSTNEGATWTTATRQDYNFFEISSGVGASTAWVKVTSHTGGVVTVKNVPMTSDAVVSASANYA